MSKQSKIFSLAILIIMILVKQFVCQPMIIKGNSMTPNFKNHEVILLNKLAYKKHPPKRFDVIVIKKNNQTFIKRVIGVQGDNIKYKNGKLYINGKHTLEHYLDKDTVTPDFTLNSVIGKKVISNGELFVLGDNREISVDSRSFGTVSNKEVIGKVVIKLWPF